MDKPLLIISCVLHTQQSVIIENILKYQLNSDLHNYCVVLCGIGQLMLGDAFASQLGRMTHS